MKAAELKVAIHQTWAFIQADAISVSLNRKTTAPDGKGGLTVTVVTVSPQTFRIIPARTRSTAQTYTQGTGEVIASKDFILMAMPDADVQRLDYFEYEGRAFQISYVQPVRTYETLCQLDEMGEDVKSTY